MGSLKNVWSWGRCSRYVGDLDGVWAWKFGLRQGPWGVWVWYLERERREDGERGYFDKYVTLTPGFACGLVKR